METKLIMVFTVWKGILVEAGMVWFYVSAWEGVQSVFEKIGLNGIRGVFEKNRVNVFNGACYINWIFLFYLHIS